MKRVLVLCVCLAIAGCAKSAPTTEPVVKGLTKFVVSYNLFIDTAGCHVVTGYADGVIEHERKPASVCERGLLWERAQAAVPKASPAAQDAPK